MQAVKISISKLQISEEIGFGGVGDGGDVVGYPVDRELDVVDEGLLRLVGADAHHPDDGIFPGLRDIDAGTPESAAVGGMLGHAAYQGCVPGFAETIGLRKDGGRMIALRMLRARTSQAEAMEPLYGMACGDAETRNPDIGVQKAYLFIEGQLAEHFFNAVAVGERAIAETVIDA